MDYSNAFVLCMRAFGSLISDIVAFLSGIYISENITLWHFSVGLSMSALLIFLVKGLFKNDD